MIMLNEVAKAGPYMVVYKDSQDPRLFYYIPRFAELAKKDDGSLIFGHQLFRRDLNNPNDGFSVYNFTVRGVLPGVEFQATKAELESMVGGSVSIVPVPGFDLTGEPITDLSFAQIGGKVQARGGNLFTDLAVSMTFQEWCEPDMARLFMSPAGWTGAINYKLTGLLTPFRAEIKANWHRVQSHFRTQTSVKYWFVSANVSYEVQKLIENEAITVTITGGTPEKKDQIYSLAKQIADRLFVRTVQPNPLPQHPGGSVVCLSLNYSRVEEDKTSTWVYEERDQETRSLGMAIVIGGVPQSYFPSLSNPIPLSLNESLHNQSMKLLNAQGFNLPF